MPSDKELATRGCEIGHCQALRSCFYYCSYHHVKICIEGKTLTDVRCGLRPADKPTMTESQTDILTDEQVAEIVSRESVITENDEGIVVRRVQLSPDERDALCHTVKALRAEIAGLTTRWCECGHAKDRHSFFSDHDECYECDQASPDLCCEWRPAPRPNENDDLQSQLEEATRQRDLLASDVERLARKERELEKLK